MRCKQKRQRKEFLDLKKIEFGEHKRRYIPVPFLDDGNGCEKVRRVCWRSPGRARKQRRRVHPRKGARSLCSPGFDIKLRVGNCRHLRRLVEKGQYSAVWRKNGVGFLPQRALPQPQGLEARRTAKKEARLPDQSRRATGDGNGRTASHPAANLSRRRVRAAWRRTKPKSHCDHACFSLKMCLRKPPPATTAAYQTS